MNVRPVRAVFKDEQGNTVGSMAIDDMRVTMASNGATQFEITGRDIAETPIPMVTNADICNMRGHQFDAAQVVYRDGVCVTRCSLCDFRSTISPKLGAKLLSMHLAAVCMDALAQEPAEVLPALQALIVKVEEEVEDLMQGIGQARHMEALLKRRLVDAATAD